MWSIENRARYDRSRLRYPSDLTEAEWDLIAPLIPPAKRGGNKRTVDLREVPSRIEVAPAMGPVAKVEEVCSDRRERSGNDEGETEN